MAIHSTKVPTLSVFANSPTSIDLAEMLAEQLHIPLVETVNASAWTLIQYLDHIALQFPNAKKPFSVDFLQGTYGRRLQQVRAEPLVRAIGIKPGVPCHVVDGTAGFGNDAVLVACAGAKVTAIERSPIIATLLADGIRRLKESPTFDALTIQIEVADTREYLTGMATMPDVIYLDPMFPERPNNAQVKKNMQLLQLLAGDPDDDADLVNAALMLGCKRVVVKRPEWAEPLVKTPSYSVPAGIIRFDVYV